nr:hypothetical protein [Tanacetum cinerariifolium]
MLNKDNYVPWSSRLLCYAKSKPNGKLLVNAIKNVLYDPSPPQRILLLISSLNSFHQEGLQNSEMTLNLALYDHEGWNDSKDSIKPVKEIVVSLNASKMLDRKKSVENNGATDKSMAEPIKYDEQESPKEVDKTNEGGRRADDELTKGASENVTKNEEEEAAGVSSSHVKSKMSFHKIPEHNHKIEKGIKNDIEPIAHTMIVNRLVLEWEEKIKLHQEKEMKFDQWKSKIFRNEHLASVKEECKLADEEGVT